ncbi:hypothetical protein [Yoonia sp.]|uniref:hypothetical protein n=1 Tax=Yoonia sp. TaxID=2212373 RepID=UPI0025D3E6D4|nr:hypothetical protein [Yoonia sp.]
MRPDTGSDDCTVSIGPKDAQLAETVKKKVAQSRVGKIKSSAAGIFLLIATGVYALAALAMATISIGLVTVSFVRLSGVFHLNQDAEDVLLSAVSSLVISVAVLDVAKYVMEDEVLRSRELREPSEARQAVTKFMVIIALVVAIEGIILVFQLGKSRPDLLFYPIRLLSVSVIIVIGLGVFQWLSVQSEERLDEDPKHIDQRPNQPKTQR